ncbi:MAG: PqqD family protein [Proteobacteria bacterium]|nr:PqqD family protein [Pseudomonadota bacterium]
MPYMLSPNVDLQPVDDSLVVLDLNQNAYFSLNGTARFFLEKLIEGTEPSQIIDDALQAFDGVDEQQVDADLQSLIAELLELKIISTKSEPVSTH